MKSSAQYSVAHKGDRKPYHTSPVNKVSNYCAINSQPDNMELGVHGFRGASKLVIMMVSG